MSGVNATLNALLAHFNSDGELPEHSEIMSVVNETLNALMAHFNSDSELPEHSDLSSEDEFFL